MAQGALRCSVYRGGSAKGLFFRAEDLPLDGEARAALLQVAMGADDPGQRDGMGGGNPDTSKVVIVSPSERIDSDVNCLALQIGPDGAVSASQDWDDILAAAGLFAIDQDMVEIDNGITSVRIWVDNMRSLAVAYVGTPDGAADDATSSVRIEFVDVRHAALRLTARLLMRGEVYVPAALLDRRLV